MIEGRPLKEIVFHGQTLNVRSERFVRVADLPRSFGIVDGGRQQCDRPGRGQDIFETRVAKMGHEIHKHIVKFPGAVEPGRLFHPATSRFAESPTLFRGGENILGHFGTAGEKLTRGVGSVRITCHRPFLSNPAAAELVESHGTSATQVNDSFQIDTRRRQFRSHGQGLQRTLAALKVQRLTMFIQPTKIR
jgi:hypothetical protein